MTIIRTQKLSGFTLVELMITLAVAAILLTIATPSYIALTANNKAATEANKLLYAINLTRSEAVKRGSVVSLCARKSPRTNPETCAASTDWSTGWLMFTDTTGTAGSFDGTDSLIQVWEDLSGNPTLTSTVNNLQYQPTGTLNSAASFSLSYTDCTGDNLRSIAISLTGRAAVTTNACP